MIMTCFTDIPNMMDTTHQAYNRTEHIQRNSPGNMKTSRQRESMKGIASTMVLVHILAHIF